MKKLLALMFVSAVMLAGCMPWWYVWENGYGH
jgi:hypothetical protein